MILWTSGEIMDDVGNEFRCVRNLLENAVNEYISERDYGEGLIEWDYIAIILDFEDPTYKEVTKYRKKRREAEFRLKIDHSEFLAADKARKVWLMSESLIRSIKMMPEIGVKDVDFDRLLEDVSNCLAEVQSRVAKEG